MKYQYSWAALALVWSAGFPVLPAIAASLPLQAEPASTKTNSVPVDTSVATNLLDAAEAEANLPKAIDLDNPQTVETETTLAGIPFTDFEREETTVDNTGGTVDPWSPIGTPSEESDTPTRTTETDSEAEVEVEPPLEWRDISEVSQTTTIDGLSDVTPDDWAFEAVRSLAEDYGCLSGFPNGTFQGDRPLTRFEFAAALNACLEAILSSEGLLPEDRETVSQLQQTFAAELSGRVDELEAQVEELSENQFSTTTRLFGQVIFGLQGRNDNDADFFPVDGIAETEDPGGGDITFYSSAQLSLLTRFSRRDLLLMSLQAGEGNSLFDSNTNTALGLTNNIRLAYESDTDFDVTLGDLTYRRLIGNRVAVIVGASGLNPISVFRGPNEEEGAGSGPLSLFAQRNPILSIGNGDKGIGFDWQIIDRLSLQAVYAVAEGSDASADGLFGGDRTVGLQLTASPTDTLNLSFNYLNDYSENGSLGTGIGDSQLTAGDAITTNAFGGTLAWDVTPSVTWGGWVGYTTSVTPDETGSVETWNWMTFLNFPDLFGEGNLGGLYVGQPPRITSSDLRQGQNIPDLLTGNLGDPGGQSDATLHIEAFYRYQLTDYLSLTPGFIVILDPANTSGSDTITIGALRTTFRF
ncbi:MAG: iron uptake porin [Cyanobacteria bacterium J06638_28]